MARSFRDRFWSPPVAKVVTAPSSILLAGVAAAIGIVATAPLALPISIVAGVALAGAAYGGRVLAAVPRAATGPRLDPFAVQEPWRRFVQEAQAGRRRFDEAVRTMDKGPLRTTLDDIGSRLDEGLGETWRVARQGHQLMRARANIDTGAITAELAQAEAHAATSADPRGALTVEALRSQLASAQRMDAVIADAVATLRLLDARLDEAVTRAIELSTRAGAPGQAAAVDGEVEGIVHEMESLRVALEEASAAGAPGPTTLPSSPPEPTDPPGATAPGA